MAGQLVVLLTVASILILVHPDTATGTQPRFGRWSPRRWISKTSVQPRLEPRKTRPAKSTHKPPVTSPVRHVKTSSSKHGLHGPPNEMILNLNSVPQRSSTRTSSPTASHNVVTTGHHEKTTARAPNTAGHHQGSIGRFLNTAGHHEVTTGRGSFTAGHHEGTTGRVPITAGQHEGTTGRVRITSGQHEGTTGRVPITAGHHEGTTGRVPITAGHHEGTTGRVPITAGHHEGTTGRGPFTTKNYKVTSTSKNANSTTNNTEHEVNKTEEWYNTTTSTPLTASGVYVCQDKTVINVTDVCDGHSDCPDGSDETATICQLLVDADSCPLFDIACDNSTKCIHVSQLCDGVKNCADGQDEKKCGFQCADGIFHIHFSSVCNNKRDCWDGSDELAWPGTNCSCSQYACPTGRCIDIQEASYAGAECWGRVIPVKNHVERFCSRPLEFLCDNDTNCRPASDRCDNFVDCMDGSDERKTDIFGDPVCDCSSFVCSNSTCISMDKICDGVNDCGDYSDEVLSDCTPNRPRKCGAGFQDEQFDCGDGTCIKNAYRCDGSSDCLNGADEMYSTCYVKPVCHEFTCSNGNCVSKSLLCNDFDDCGDFSDELYCTRKNPVILHDDDDDDDDLFDDNLGLYVPLTVFSAVIVFFVTVAIIAAVMRRNVKRNARVQRSRDVRARVACMTPVFVGPPSYSEAVGECNVQRKTECSFVNPLSGGNSTDP